MEIFIPTRGRIDNQLTMQSLMLEQRWDHPEYHVHFVVPRSEAKAFGRRYPFAHVIQVPDDMKIGSIHQYTLELDGDARRVWIDDDFTFHRRRKQLSPSQAGSKFNGPADVTALFHRIEHWFAKGYAHGGISMRQANHYCDTGYYQVVGRVCGFIWCDARIMRAEKIRFNAVEEHQAYHMALSLLELGYPNVIDYEFMFGHAGTNAAGGCSSYRTVKYIQEQNTRLLSLHPNAVTLFWRQLKGKAAKAISTEQGIPAVKIAWVRSYATRVGARRIPTHRLNNIKVLYDLGD